MADSQASLRQSLANVEAQIVALTSNVALNYSLDGESVSPVTDLRSLIEMRDLLREQLIREEGPAEVRAVGTT